MSLRRVLVLLLSLGLLLSFYGKLLELNRHLETTAAPAAQPTRLTEVVPRTCCYKGIRCDPLDFYQIFIIQGERPDGRLKLMYAPITDSLLRGLQSREGECGYKTWRMLPPRKQDTFNFSVFNSSGPRPGDVVLFVGTLFSPNFTARCENQWAPNRIFCIWYQVEPRDYPNASRSPGEGVCEVWDYTHGNDPRGRVVRYVPPGFVPAEDTEELNDQMVRKRAQSLKPMSLLWYFIGRLGPERQKCWDHFQTLKYFQKHELKKIPKGGDKGYPPVYTRDDWKKLGRLKNAVFLNFHQACNRSQPLETKPLETVRLAQLLSLGFLVVSEEVNLLDAELYKDTIIIEKHIFDDQRWSPFLQSLLKNRSALVDFQWQSYQLFKQRFAPAALLRSAAVWDGGAAASAGCET
ncbi:unnamed protein product [Effrenium voratum]|uniref:Uncharacterized protein n=1 Tax=Effrenium voratum TaxID=2562239 RepID=A0AA36MVQ9_9DINO|nr:unnamed protein product [Effrenium voratum]CAJ1458182.1 unnamed protein product [Effrenium voratum]